MSKLFELFLGSILMTIFAIALIVFSALHYILRLGGIADAGCDWHGSAKTWVDSNGDGIVNNAEPPLGEVEIHVDDFQNQFVDVGWPAITDKMERRGSMYSCQRVQVSFLRCMRISHRDTI
jgi:hypothetical protein